MNVIKFNRVVNKYKKCPECGASYKSNKMSVELKDEIIIISCECGFNKYVNEDNETVE